MIGGADSIDDLGAPRGVLLYRPRSGRGLEEVSVGLHSVRDMVFDEDRSQVHTAVGPRIMARQAGDHQPAAGRDSQHRRRPALSRPAAQPPSPDDHEVLNDFAEALC